MQRLEVSAAVRHTVYIYIYISLGFKRLIIVNSSMWDSSPNSLLSVITKIENQVFCDVHSLLQSKCHYGFTVYG